jgi:adenylate cyclase
MQAVRTGDHNVRVSVYDGSEIGLLQSGFNDMVRGLEEREQLRDLFGKHVGTEVLEQSLETGAELGGAELDVAVLFCDLTGSTQLALDRSPHEVVELLNRFFAIIIEAVAEENGTVNKFLGDAGLCVFGAPLTHDDPCGAALRAAVSIRSRLLSELPGYDAGIGLSSGTVVAGNVGSVDRFEYTVIGDAVNEAARLTDLAKREPGRILASESCVLRNGVPSPGWVISGRERLRGRSDPTTIFKPAGEDPPGGHRLRIPAVRSRPHRSRSDGGRI